MPDPRRDLKPDPYLREPVPRTREPWAHESVGTIPAPQLQRRDRVKVTANSQSTTSGSQVALSFNAEVYDIGGLWAVSPNPTRITMQPGAQNGTWLMIGEAAFDTNATGARAVGIRQNGTTYVGLIQAAPIPSGILSTYLQVSAMVNEPKPGDYFELVVLQLSGGNLDVSGRLEVIQVW